MLVLSGMRWSLYGGVCAWQSPDGKHLFVELDSIPRNGINDKKYLVNLQLALPDLNRQEGQTEKSFKVRRSSDKAPYLFKMRLPSNLITWTPATPFGYRLSVDVREDLGEITHEIVKYEQTVTFQGTVEPDDSATALYEDGRYAGYDGALPDGEVDFRVKMYRNRGYSIVRDKDYTSSPHMALACASLGMLCEPLMKPYTATDEQGRNAYLDEVSRWVKMRAGNASVWHWLLPEMPDSVAELCRRRILELDARPIFQCNDTTLMPADDPLPEISLMMAKESPEPIVQVAEASLLHAAPGIDYLYRVNCGGEEVTDSNGNIWMADTLSTNLVGCSLSKVTVMVAEQLKLMDPADQPVMQSYRLCNTDDEMVYHFPVDSLGSYCIEVFMQEPVLKRTGGRMFQVRVNDNISKRIDLIRLSGQRNMAVKLAFSFLSKDKDYIDISFPKPYAGHAIISAIAIGKLNGPAIE